MELCRVDVLRPPPAAPPVNDVTVSGVGHAGDILNLFATNTPEWGATDVGRVLGISKSHAHRLLSSLNALGLLERQPRNRRYRLGWRWLSVAAVLIETNPLVTNAVPVIRELQEQLDVTGRLSVWDRDGVISLQPGRDPILTRDTFGDCVPVSTVLLAGRSRTAIRGSTDILTSALTRSSGDLDERLTHVRTGGLIGDPDHGQCRSYCLAAPVIDTDGGVIAALSVHLPTRRWEPQKLHLMRALRTAATRLSANAT